MVIGINTVGVVTTKRATTTMVLRTSVVVMRMRMESEVGVVPAQAKGAGLRKKDHPRCKQVFLRAAKL